MYTTPNQARCWHPAVRIPRRRPKTHWRDYIAQLAWEHLGVVGLGFSSYAAVPATQPQISRRRWMDGSMDR